MRRVILLALLVCLTGISPAQRKTMYQEPSCDQVITQAAPTLWLDAERGITESSTAVSAWASRLGAVTFTQATGANQPAVTRSDGRENRLVYSEDVSKVSGSAWWVYTRTVNISATEFKEDATAADSHVLAQSTVPIISGQSYVLEASLKRGTGSRNAKILIDGGAGNPYFAADLSNCTMNDATGWVSRTIGVDPVDATYCRVYLNLLADGTEAAAYFRIYMADAAFSTIYDGDNSSSLHLTRVIWRTSLANPEYLPTTTYAQYRGINGRRAVRFDGSNDVMTSTATLANLFGAGAKTAIMVVRPAALTAAATRMLLVSSSTYWVTDLATDGDFTHINYDTNSDVSDKATTTGVNVLTALHDTGNIYAGVGNAMSVAVASGNTGALTDTLALGATAAAATPYTGDIAELITFNRVLPGDTRARINRCLCKKWGASCN